MFGKAHLYVHLSIDYSGYLSLSNNLSHKYLNCCIGVILPLYGPDTKYIISSGKFVLTLFPLLSIFQ